MGRATGTSQAVCTKRSDLSTSRAANRAFFQGQENRGNGGSRVVAITPHKPSKVLFVRVLLPVFLRSFDVALAKIPEAPGRVRGIRG